MKAEIPIWILMKITEKEIERRINEKTVALGLTTAQIMLMHFICRKSGRICQKDMEERFDLSHATVSGIITRLEAKGFIEARPGDEDKRRKVICATERGLACYDEIHGYIANSDLQLMDGLTDEERRSVRELMLRMLGNLNVALWVNTEEEE